MHAASTPALRRWSRQARAVVCSSKVLTVSSPPAAGRRSAARRLALGAAKKRTTRTASPQPRRRRAPAPSVRRTGFREAPLDRPRRAVFATVLVRSRGPMGRTPQGTGVQTARVHRSSSEAADKIDRAAEARFPCARMDPSRNTCPTPQTPRPSPPPTPPRRLSRSSIHDLPAHAGNGRRRRRRTGAHGSLRAGRRRVRAVVALQRLLAARRDRPRRCDRGRRRERPRCPRRGSHSDAESSRRSFEHASAGTAGAVKLALAHQDGVLTASGTYLSKNPKGSSGEFKSWSGWVLP